MLPVSAVLTILCIVSEDQDRARLELAVVGFKILNRISKSKIIIFRSGKDHTVCYSEGMHWSLIITVLDFCILVFLYSAH